MVDNSTMYSKAAEFGYSQLRHSFQNIIEDKKLQGNVRRTIQTAKKDFWSKFQNCGKEDRNWKKMWGMIKRMNWIKKRECVPSIK